MYYKISVPDKNDAIMRLSLDKSWFYFRTTYNSYGSFWCLSIYDAAMNPIVYMMKLVPGTIWNFFYRSRNVPQGAIGVLTEKESIGRDDFNSGIATLVYIPE